MAVKPIPDGYRTVTPYLPVENANLLLDFVQKAFDGKVRARLDAPGGKVGHAEVVIGDSLIMLADASTADPGQPMPAMIHLYVEKIDDAYRRAIEAGATSVREPENMFYGDRAGAVRDPVGNMWWIATRVEEVSPEEMARRAQEQMAQGS